MSRPRRKCSTCPRVIRTRRKDGVALCAACTKAAPAGPPQTVDARLQLARKLQTERGHAAELKRLTAVENHRQDVLAAIRAMTPLVGVPKVEAPARSGAALPTHTWGLIISDWQLGQHDTFASTGGMFEQSTAIVKKQVHELWNVVARLHDIYRPSIHVEELVIFSLGDLLENDQMRPSQAGQIDALVTRQCVDVIDLENWLIAQSLARFPKVRVLHVGGNHERTSPKAGNAGLGELGFTDTYSWIIGEMLKRSNEKAIEAGRLDIVNHESFFGAAKVAGLRCVYEHGASFRSATGSYGGVSYYSIAKAAAGYAQMLEGADVVLMGHHHVPMLLPMGQRGHQVMNGALTPSSGYGQTNFKSVRRPSQTLLDFNAKHGLVGYRPIYLDEASQMLKPGTFWEGVK